MKNFEQYLNESNDRLTFLERPILNSVKSLFDEETESEKVEFKEITDEIGKILKINGSLKLLHIEHQLSILFPNEFGRGGNMSFPPDWKDHRFVYDSYKGTVRKHKSLMIVCLAIFKKDDSEFMRGATYVNPELFVNMIDLEMLLAIMKDKMNRKVMNECMGYEWYEKFMNDHKGAIKLKTYDL